MPCVERLCTSIEMAATEQKENLPVVSSKTEELRLWICKVKQKKLMSKRERDFDLRKVAILESALLHAEMDLKQKQQERFQRWQTLKKSLVKKRESTDSDNCPYCWRMNMFGDVPVSNCNCMKRQRIEKTVSSAYNGTWTVVSSLSSRNYQYLGCKG